jgi:hypothetical protein
LGYPPALTHALPTRVPLGDLAMAA